MCRHKTSYYVLETNWEFDNKINRFATKINNLDESYAVDNGNKLKIHETATKNNYIDCIKDNDRPH